MAKTDFAEQNAGRITLLIVSAELVLYLVET